MRHFAIAILILSAAGCGMKPLDQQVKKSDSSIIGKTTQDVGQFDPNAGAKVNDLKVQASDPLTAVSGTYTAALGRLEISQIEHAVNLFHASEDRYPKDMDEFMQRIIKENNIKLPVLAGGKKYQYDVENHTLVIVDPPADGK